MKGLLMNLRLASILVCLLAVPAVSFADDAAIKKVVKEKVNVMNDAKLKGDYSKLADLMHARVIQSMGGKENMIAQTDKMMKMMKKDGIEFKSFKLGEPSAIVKQGTDLYIYVPNEMTITIKGGKLIQQNYVVGVSPDQGKSWTFAETDSTGRIKKIFPNLPNELKLPDTKKPVYVED
jgi:hypothetical protein